MGDPLKEKYQRVEKKKEETQMLQNEIRITAKGKRKNYITYALALLTREKDPEETIILKAMGQAITKTVTVAEIIKRRVGGLHQNSVLDSSEITDVWEPLEEGLDIVKTVRRVSSISITLSKKALPTDAAGYQPPLPLSEVSKEGEGGATKDGGDNRRGRRRRRGGRGGGGENRGRRGRRGGRGGGGDGGDQGGDEEYEEDAGESQPRRGRGRGRGRRRGSRRGGSRGGGGGGDGGDNNGRRGRGRRPRGNDGGDYEYESAPRRGGRRRGGGGGGDGRRGRGRGGGGRGRGGGGGGRGRGGNQGGGGGGQY